MTSGRELIQSWPIGYDMSMRRHGHARADARNLYLHRVALRKLRRHPELIGEVVALIDRWLDQPEPHPARRWLNEWRQMLTSWTLESVEELVLDEQKGQVLRQCSPLAPVLTPVERWAALDEVNRQLASATEVE